MKPSRALYQWVRLFTRPNCGLCSNAYHEIEQAAAKSRFTYDEVDITKPENKEWFDKYAFDVPVIHVSKSVTYDQPKVFMHRVTAQQIIDSIKST